MHPTEEAISANVQGLDYEPLDMIYRKSPEADIYSPSDNSINELPTCFPIDNLNNHSVRHSVVRSLSLNGDFTISIENRTGQNMRYCEDNMSPTSLSCKFNLTLDYDEASGLNKKCFKSSPDNNSKRNSNYPFTPMVLRTELHGLSDYVLPDSMKSNPTVDRSDIPPRASLCSGPGDVPFISINIPLNVPSIPPRSNSKSQTPRSAVGLSNQVNDLYRIQKTLQRLHQSCWYYEGLTSKDGMKLLENTEIGTFLMRESSDPMFLFSLSVQTDRGPTSVRIHYTNGQFQLDAVNTIYQSMPKFDCVVSLVNYYVKLGESQYGRSHVWVDKSGASNSKLKLSKPLYKCVPSLKQLGILKINSIVPPGKVSSLLIPQSLQNNLRDYPASL